MTRHAGRVAFAYGAFLLLVALQRVFELVLSRRNVARLLRDPGSRSSETPFEFAQLVAVHVALLTLPLVEHVVAERRPHPVVVGVALAAFAAAQWLRLASIRALGTTWNARALVAPSSPVIDRGPYRHVRHPNYAAVLVEFQALPWIGGAWMSWIVLNALHAPILARRIQREERLLAGVPGWHERMRSKPRFWPH